MRVLLTDDEEILLEGHKLMLERIVPRKSIVAVNNYKDALDAAKEAHFDVAILDIEMPGMDGIELAKHLKAIYPKTNIIFLTAYKEYALDACKLYASGYLLKPLLMRDLKEVFENLRYAVEKDSHAGKGFYVQCFGKFEVYYNGKPVAFKRSKAKEILAYLVDIQGTSATTEEIASVLWEDVLDTEKTHKYLWTLMTELKRVLMAYGMEDILIHRRNSYAIDRSKLKCDFFDYLDGKEESLNSWRGEYMIQYSWAETTNAWLTQTNGIGYSD